MFVKKIAVLCAFALSFVFAPAAFAWQQVCMHLPFWQTGFAANFHVVYNFPEESGRIPYYYYDDELRRDNWLPPSVGENKNIAAQGQITSGNISVGRSQCVGIRPYIGPGIPFFVYVQTSVFTGYDICSTHSSNPNRWYHQQSRPYSKIWFKATGLAGNPRCEYWKESN